MNKYAQAYIDEFNKIALLGNFIGENQVMAPKAIEAKGMSYIGQSTDEAEKRKKYYDSQPKYPTMPEDIAEKYRQFQRTRTLVSTPQQYGISDEDVKKYGIDGWHGKKNHGLGQGYRLENKDPDWLRKATQMKLYA